MVIRSRVCLLMLKEDLGSVLESDLRQKRKYGALKACIMLKVVSSGKKSQC